jgi:holo-[acyl-carrier protein] synthase
MTIVGCGIDLVDIAAFARSLAVTEGRLASVCFSDREIADARDRPECLAMGWAVKEAVAKALGVGLMRGVAFKDIEFSGHSKTPGVTLQERPTKIADERGIRHWLVSVSRRGTWAVAAVVAIGS